MKMSEVLTLAKEKLDCALWVCVAIDYCDAPAEDKRRTQKYIDKLIHPAGTVTCWLECVAKISVEQLTSRNLKTYRERWLDHMISELEKEGR
jgi:hypothetical protein